MMVPSRRGVIVNISSPAAAGYIQTTAYGVIKAALDRLSGDMAHELRPHNVASISIWPGAIATERVKTMVNKSTAPLHGAKDETPVHVGRGVAALAGDPDIISKSGAVFTTADLGLEYGFTDIDGSRPPNARDTFWPPPPPPIYRDLQPQRLGLPKVRA
jgi:dehydrogenase/reductase SDR family protein 1